MDETTGQSSMASKPPTPKEQVAPWREHFQNLSRNADFQETRKLCIQHLGAGGIEAIWNGLDEVFRNDLDFKGQLELAIQAEKANVLVGAVIGDEMDGINGRDIIAERPDFCKSAWSIVMTQGFIVFKGIPQSGKTASLQLLGRHARSLGMEVSYFKATALLSRERLEEGLQRRCGVSLEALFSRNFDGRIHLLIIDEAQKLFKKGDKYSAGKLWEIMGEISSAQPHGQSSALRVAIAVKYGNEPSGLTAVEQRNQRNMSGAAAHEDSDEDEDMATQGTLYSDSSLDSVPVISPMVWGVRRTVEMQPLAKLHAPDIALRLSVSEYHQVLERLRQKLDRQELMSNPHQAHILYTLANGLAGLIMALLDELCFKLRNCSPSVSAIDVMWYLLRSKSVFDALYPLRSFLRNEKITQAQLQIIQKVLEAPGEELNVESLAPDLRAHADSMSRQGLVQRLERNKIGFASRLHSLYYVQMLCGMTEKPRFVWDHDASMLEFIKLSIAAMSSKTLKTTLARGKRGQIVERQFQMLWTTSSAYAMPIGASQFPDVGCVFETMGALDFYMIFEGQQLESSWAIELLVNGDRAEQHARRFREGGLYSSIPYSQHCCIDFRDKEPHSLSKTNEDFLYIFFTDEYTKARLRIKDEIVATIDLAP